MKGTGLYRRLSACVSLCFRKRIKRYDDLKGKLIGVQRGGRYDHRFDGDTELKKFEHTSYESLLQMLELDRLDVVVMPDSLARHLLRELQVDAEASPFIIKGEPAYIAISRKSELSVHLEVLKQTLQQIRESGEYERILSRYLLPRSDPTFPVIPEAPDSQR